MAPITPVAATCAVAVSFVLAWLVHAAPVDTTPAYAGGDPVVPHAGLPDTYLHGDDSDDSDGTDSDSDSGADFDLPDTPLSIATDSDRAAVLLHGGDRESLIVAASGTPVEDNHAPTVVPLPAALALFASALYGLSFLRRR